MCIGADFLGEVCASHQKNSWSVKYKFNPPILLFYRAFADLTWLSDNEFITDNNLAYARPAVIRDKEYYVFGENIWLQLKTLLWQE